MEEESRKKNKKKEAPASGWQMIYCSLALILVALFAMLVSYSTIRKDKIDVFQKRQVYITTGDKPYEGSDSPNFVEENMWKKQSEFTTRVSESLETYLTQAGLGKSVSVEKIEKGFRVVFGGNILFLSGAAEINKDAYSCLDEMIKIARNNPLFVRVEGHTDNVPINTPRFPSNWELSTMRAVNILRYLIEKGVLPAERLAAVGFSQYHPVASNDVSEGRQKNRRVEFYFELSS
jgi:chemotaxis protein MotB